MQNRGKIEAVLFVSGDPVQLQSLAIALDITALELETEILALREFYIANDSGIRVRFVGDKVQLYTHQDAFEVIKRLLQPEKTKNFSKSVLETLAIIAYKQPVTRSQIDAIRGVRCEYSVSQLMLTGFVQEVGRLEAVGRPALLGTTDKFLSEFNVQSLDDLPRCEALTLLEQQPHEDE